MANGDFPIGPPSDDDWSETGPPAYEEAYYPDEEGYPSDDEEYFTQSGPTPTPEPAAPKRVRHGLELTPPEELVAEAKTVLMRLMGHCNGKEVEEVIRIIGMILAAKVALKLIEEASSESHDAILDVCDALLYEVSKDDPTTRLNFAEFVSIPDDSSAGKILVKALHYHEADPVNRPQQELHHLQERIQRTRTRTQLLSVVGDIDSNVPPKQLVTNFRQIESPTLTGSVENMDFSKTAAEWDEEERNQETTGLRFSSGLYSLDQALSSPEEELGIIRTGEFMVIAAGTGHGKSTIARPMVTAMTLDLVRGYGLTDARSMHFFTEEEPGPIIRAMRLRKQDRFHGIANNVQIVRIGSSRKAMVKAFYDRVRKAIEMAELTRRPITDFMPYIMSVDYLGAINEPGEPQDSIAIEKTANLNMRGFAACDILEIEKYGEVNFEEYTGMPWPRKELSHHRIAVIAYAQLRKPTKRDTWHEGMPTVDFVVEGPKGDGWDVYEGDSIVPSREEVRGSSVLINHCTTLLMLHRSRPKTGKRFDENGEAVGLLDTRMHVIVDKARNAVEVNFIPFRADSGPGTGRMMFWDDFFFRALEDGKIDLDNFDEIWTEHGDPAIPKRARQRLLAGVRYTNV